MHHKHTSRRRWVLLLPLFAWIGLNGAACKREGGGAVPAPNTGAYLPTLAAFYGGLAALQSGDNRSAESLLNKAVQLAPGEPAAWANLGLFYLRNSAQFEKAAAPLEKARSLAPDNSQIQMLLGLLESRRGKFAEAAGYYRRAVELDPRNLKARYVLAEELEKQNDPASTAEARHQIKGILQIQPRNQKALIELARIAAKQNDAATLREAIARLEERAPGWKDQRTHEIFNALKQAAAKGETRQIATGLLGLGNVLMSVPSFKQDLNALKMPPIVLGEPLETPLKLSVPPSTPSPPDTALSFASAPIPSAPVGKWAFSRALTLVPQLPLEVARTHRLTAMEEEAPVYLFADASAVQVMSTGGKKTTLPFPGGPRKTPPAPDGVLALDWSYDFRMDFALAGEGGFRLYRQEAGGRYVEATAAMKLPASVTKAAYYGAWAADVDMEGDIDIVLAPLKGAPLVIRNNGDGTGKVLNLFPEIHDLRGFAWGDIDADGDPDAVMLEATGRLRVLANERSMLFRERPVPPEIGSVAAITIADGNNDGTLDVLALRTDGSVALLQDKDEGQSWEVKEVARWPQPVTLKVGEARLIAADLDNNGGLDLAAFGAGSANVWLSDEKRQFRAHSTLVGDTFFSVADINGDGRLDLVGLAQNGQPVQAVNRGTKSYHWQVLRPRATGVERSQTGDSRINTFGIGGEIEIRAGLLVQKQLIQGPALHFGLGDRTSVDVIRIIWPNGAPQALQSELPSPTNKELRADLPIVTVQRLTGSCPWLFAFDGRKMQFITDFIWRSPLGLKINAQDTAGVATTEDWVKVRGDQLAPKNGFYDLRITAELWETHFFDFIELMVVDHPAGTEVFVDERFVFPPPKLQVYVTGPLHPVVRAVDDHGTDVTAIVRAKDGRYLDTFGRGQYQGVTRDHYVEVEIPENLPRTGPAYLVAYGWVHPTDSSINVALGQGSHPPPKGLRMEVPDGRGGWVVAKPNLGFPAGKTKTVLLPLEGVFRPGTPRKVRLATNLEVFWDSIEVAVGLPKAAIRTRRIAPATADLRYRGYSETYTADRSSPELPIYERIAATGQQWRDLIGFYTRFGDVRELLRKVDDRYVIMNAGDELAFRFPAPPPPPRGWVRDYVFIGDGWEKDGNLNTTFSKTVLPLPSHARADYSTPPGRLEEDPVYRRYPQDWVTYHTRYVSPEQFHYALRPKGQP